MAEGEVAVISLPPAPSAQSVSFGRGVVRPEPPVPRDGAATDPIRADGQVVWTRDFERCAGVQFVDISGATRQQVRQWLSIEPSEGAAAEGERVQRDAIETELPEPTLTLHTPPSHATPVAN